MDTSSLMEQILSSDNLNRAYLQVVRNKGAEGVDGMKYTELKEHLAKNGENIKEQLRTRKYKPQPVPNGTHGGVRGRGFIKIPFSIYCLRASIFNFPRFISY